MRARIGDRNPMLFYNAVGTNESRGTNRPFRDFALRIFARTPRAIRFHSFFAWIGKQNERKIEFADELIVGVDTIWADTYNDGVGFSDCVDSVAEPARFLGSARGIVFGIKPEDDVLTRVIRQ